ncbi:uncharacterized protein LOC128222150 [Mya arenaria]|uniref:uncharacterized protein LOC128222150 n=1 Tax=Mya arenaria TaxID=6604 RepID=UPI0022E787CE|nr:uncharacterized protein LOC128222150 [Mya arenaria]XP_052786983.1 uncharacterized protein LOC128222150 [Mya arenaria]
MATYKDILNEKENQNWLKGSLALRITKAGLRNLVEGDSYRVQQKIHSSIIQAGNLAPGTSCSLCFTENLILCPTKGLCSNPRNCKYHNSALKMFQPCPSQICDDFRDEICAVHRYGGPSWKNTKADQWCTNHWQVAKCFMPPDGYQDVSSFDETDFNGIISVMINCTEIQRSLSFNIANQPNQPNILTKARQIGRSIRHSPDLKVTDTDLADYFATLNTLLTDATYLAGESNAQQAVIKLKQLEKDALPISSDDVRELLEEARGTIEAGKHGLLQSVETRKQEIQDEVAKGKTAVATGKREIEETVFEGKSDIATGKREIEETVSEGKTAFATGKREIEETVLEGKSVIAIGKREIEETVAKGTIFIASGKREIEVKVSESKSAFATGKREIEETVSECKSAVTTGKREIEETVAKGTIFIASGKREIEGTVSECKSAVATGKREIEDTASEALQKIRDVSTLSYAEQKKDMQQQLAKCYRKQLNSAPISSLLSDVDERLDKFYVPPKIVKKNHRKVGATEKEKGTPVASYRQLFGKTGEFRKNVFIVGEAGMGKTSCAAMCALKWANQFSSTNTTNEHGKNVSNPTLSKSLEKILRYCSKDIKDIFIPKTELDDQFKDDTFYKEVEFLFYLTLRDSCDVCDLTDMIRDQLINRIYQQDKRTAALSTMHSVLSNNKCVIIIDGLDEWTHPNDTNCSCSEEDKVIPYLAPTIDATVLITSRPWRMSQQRVKDTKIDTYLEIEGTACIGLLLQKVMDSLNETVTEKKKLPDFVEFVIRMNLARLLSVPILSMLLVCLWFEGMYESLSVCDIYAFTVEMMFGRKTLPVPNVSQVEIPFPRCFQHTKKVQMYYSIVMEMAQLAFTTLFSIDQTSALVFKKVDILSHENLLFVLKSGILQETKARSLLRKSSNYSFIHKSVQEFLAAIYMSYHPEEFHRVFLPFYQKNGALSDISQVFIFMCGLNIKLANEMSALISKRHNRIRSLFNDNQDVIVSGYKEAKASQVLNIQLSLYYFDYTFSSDTELLNDLLAMNKSKVRSIKASSETSQASLQEVFSSSTNTLYNVQLFYVAGQYDLSACKCLNDVSIYGSKLTDIVINTKNLFSLYLENVSKRVEYSIWQSLKRGSDNLIYLNINCITNNSLFCQILPQLIHLKCLTMDSIDLGDQTLLPPASAISVDLKWVTMTARALIGMVERLEKNTNKSVECKLFLCAVDTNIANEEIKHYIPRIQILDKKFTIRFRADMVICVYLERVRMTARSLKGLVEKLENSTHRVKCELRGCTVDPITEYEEIKRFIQTSERFDSEILNDPISKIDVISFTKEK